MPKVRLNCRVINCDHTFIGEGHFYRTALNDAVKQRTTHESRVSTYTLICSLCGKRFTGADHIPSNANVLAEMYLEDHHDGYCAPLHSREGIMTNQYNLDLSLFDDDQLGYLTVQGVIKQADFNTEMSLRSRAQERKEEKQKDETLYGMTKELLERARAADSVRTDSLENKRREDQLANQQKPGLYDRYVFNITKLPRNGGAASVHTLLLEDHLDRGLKLKTNFDKMGRVDRVSLSFDGRTIDASHTGPFLFSVTNPEE